MEWKELLCDDRIRSFKKTGPSNDLRTEFEKDYHRIIGSASFRRLQDKTQVFPLDQSDFVRTRLTHSMEVSSFCKSLGQNISKMILMEIKDESFLPSYQADVCDILQCAGLLHDIGNPPFGHFGETVIRNWFQKNLSQIRYPLCLLDSAAPPDSTKPLSELLTPQMQNDFYHFEGNTQALRVVTKLHYLVDEHGMNLTKGLLGTIIKYPVSSVEIDKKSENIRCHKMGYYYADTEIFSDVENALGLNGCRHPLTFVLEAADDIAYLTADIEDAYKKKLISYDSLIRELEAQRPKPSEMCQAHLPDEKTDNDEYENLLRSLRYRYDKGVERRVSDPGAYAIQNWIVTVQGKLIADATVSFRDHYDQIMAGTFQKELLDGTPGNAIRKALGNIAYQYAFQSESILKIEIAANRILSSLLDTYVPAILYADTTKGPDEIGGKIISLISDNYKAIYKIYSEGKSELEKLYLRLLLVTDDICGMTDSYAKRLYQEMNGGI